MSSDWSRGEPLDPGVDAGQVDGELWAGSPSWSSNCTPSSGAPENSVISSAVAIRVLLGTQSVTTAEPPRPSLSTTVTSAPICTATSAAS